MINKKRKLKINSTVIWLFSLVLLTNAIFVFAIFFIFLPRIAENLRDSKREMIKELTSTTLNILKTSYNLEQNGTLTREEAQSKAKMYVKDLHYGFEDEGYFWILDTSHIGVIHSREPHFNGANMKDYKDAKGRYVFQEMVSLALEKKKGYLRYYWPLRSKSDVSASKQSYIKLFKPWSWIIGTGIYDVDVENQVAAIIKNQIWITLLITCCTFLLSSLVLFHGVSAETRSQAATADLFEYQNHLEELVQQRTVELDSSNKKLHVEIEIQKQLESDVRQILNAPGDGICVLDKERKLIYVNEVFCALLNCVESDLMNKSYCDIPWENCFMDSPKNASLSDDHDLLKIIGGKEKIDRELKKKGDENKYFRQLIVPYKDTSGAIIGAVECFRDITEHKNALEIEQQKALQEARLDMLNNILHDIGNAITSIGTSIAKPLADNQWLECKSIAQFEHFLEKKKSEFSEVFGADKSRHLFAYLRTLGEALKKKSGNYHMLFKKLSMSVSHVNSILDLQRVYARNIAQSENRNLKISDLLHDAIFIFGHNFEKREIKVAMDIKIDLPLVSGDSTRLIQIFINIMKNTCEAFDEMEGAIEKTCLIKAHASVDREKVIIEILDNDIGFEPEKAASFFKRGASSKNRDSGLGLYQVANIIESHNGKIRMESPGPGKGAKTIIELPACSSSKKTSEDVLRS